MFRVKGFSTFSILESRVGLTPMSTAHGREAKWGNTVLLTIEVREALIRRVSRYKDLHAHENCAKTPESKATGATLH